MQLDTAYLDRPLDELAAVLAPADLARLQAALTEEAAILKRRKGTFDALLLRLYGDKAKLAYQTAKKDTGVVHIAASSTLDLTVDVDKDVKWDQPLLRAALDNMPPDAARHYAKVEISVEEKKFSAAPPDIMAALQRARTVKPGRMKFTLKPVDVEAV